MVQSTDNPTKKKKVLKIEKYEPYHISSALIKQKL